MGSGASKGLTVAVQHASQQDICSVISGLPSDVRNTLAAALNQSDSKIRPEDAKSISEEDVQVKLIFEAGVDDLCTGGGCAIEKTEERGITLVQLQAIIRHISRRCGKEGWTSTNPHNPGRLTVEVINLYDVAFWVLRPATKPRQCSYIELVADNKQPPQWFVSHWWGEAVACFMKCIEEHMGLRGLAVSVAYWVCAYANNQHQLGGEISQDPQETSFFRALSRSEGVLVVLDENSTPFTRVWCAFEEACTTRAEVTRKEMLLDIATATAWKDRQGIDHDACILTTGLTPLETSKDQACAGVGNRLKVYRESMFPVAYIQKALAINIEHAEASQPADKRRILNSITKRSLDELDEEPFPAHPEYDRVNKELRGLFAVAGWRSTLQYHPEVLKKFSEAVRADSERRELGFSFAFSKEFTSERLQEVAAGLPPNLHELRLDCGFCPNLVDDNATVNSGFAALGSAFPSSLRTLNIGLKGVRLNDSLLESLVQQLPPSLITLTLDLSDNWVSDHGIGVLAQNLPQSVKHLSLGLQSAFDITDDGLEWLADCLPQAIESVKLDLMNANEITGNGIRTFTKKLPDSLRVLNLVLLRGMINSKAYYIGDSALSALADCLPTALQAFQLDMSNDNLITDEGLLALGKDMPERLCSLQLELRGCSGISTDGMASFVACIQRLEKLNTLHLGVEDCQGMTDASLLALAGNLPKELRSLSVDVAKCVQISAEAFPGFVETVPRSLRELELLMSGCYCLGDAELCSIATHLPSLLTSLHLSAAGCFKLGDEGFTGLVGKLPGSLEILKLNFSEDVLLTAAAPRKLASSCPTSLHTLSLNFSGCSGIKSDGLDELMNALPVQSLSFSWPAQEHTEGTWGFTSSERDFVIVSADGSEAKYDAELCGQAPYITVLLSPPVMEGSHSFTFEMGAKSVHTYFNVGALPSPLPKDLGTNTGKAVGEEVGGWAGSSDGSLLVNNTCPGKFCPNFNSTGERIELILDVTRLQGTIVHVDSCEQATFSFTPEDLPLHPAICLGIGASMKFVSHE